MAVNVGNLLVGPCKIFKVDTVDCGATQDGVETGLTLTTKSIEIDQFVGDALVALTNRVYMVKTKLAEATLANAQRVWSLSAGPASDGAGGTVLYLGVEKVLPEHVLYFVGRAPSTKQREVTFNRAVAMKVDPVPFKKDDNQFFHVEFACLPDTSQPAGQEYGKVNDTVTAY